MPVNIPKGKLSEIILDVFNNTAIPAFKEEAKALADEFCQELRDNIITRDIKYKELSKNTLLKKKYKGSISKSPLIDTGAYIASIQVREKNGKYTVGVGDEIHPSSADTGGEPLPMRKLARWLEFGNAQIPARPHWRPTLSSFNRRKEIRKKDISKRLSNEITKRLREFNKERFRTK